MILSSSCSFFFFFNDTATTEIYTLSLHDALPICGVSLESSSEASFDRNVTGNSITANGGGGGVLVSDVSFANFLDRKSTRLNSSHSQISYAVFCLKKKKTNTSYKIGTLEEGYSSG